MNLKPVSLALGLASASVAYGQFTPIPLNPSSFNHDLVVEAEARPGLIPATSATIDEGAGNTSNTWYESGYNTGAPDSGLPLAGTEFTSVSSANHVFRMAPSYSEANGVLIDTVATNATLTPTTPAAYSALSFLTSGGRGGGQVNVTVRHADGSSQEASFFSPDWFNGADPAWIAYGRANAQTFNFDTQGSITDPGNPRLYSRDITLDNTTSPVTSIELRYGTGAANAHNGIMAVSGATSVGGPFTPIAVTGYTHDFVIEAGANVRGELNATTESMDSAVNSGNSWFEVGYNTAFPEIGLPAAGSTVTSASAGDHTYAMPLDYSQPNALFLDPSNTSGTLTFAEERAVSALSFLAAAGNGPATLDLSINHLDGSIEFATISVPDWFNGANPVVTVNGRVEVHTGVFNNVNGNNPRVYGIDVPLSNTTSPVTSVDLVYTSTGGRAAFFAVSGTSGAVAPIITTQPASVVTTPGSSASFTVVADGTAPISYQWERLVNGEWVAVIDAGNFSGSSTETLQVTSAEVADTGTFRVVTSNAGGTVTSETASLTVLSPLTDVTASTDSVIGFGGTWPNGEAPSFAIDDTTAKYLNRGLNNAAPYEGPAGLIVSPAVGRTIVTGLRIYTANDATERDPINYRLEGSNDGGNTFEVVSEGPLSLPTRRNTGVFNIDPTIDALQQVVFENEESYAVYRLSFDDVRNNTTAVAMQIGEVEFLGVTDQSGAPSISLPTPAFARAAEGGQATFSVTASGNPAPALQWQRLVNDQWVNLVDGSGVFGATTATLTLSDLDRSDAGSFRVTASSSSGTVTSGPVQLTVFSSLTDITSAFDLITGFGDTAIGAPNGPASTEPFTAFDEAVNAYLNRGSGPSAQAGFPPFEGPVGIEITPAAGATTVQGIRFYAGTGSADADPADYRLEGSNDGSTYTLISEGSLNLPTTRNAAADLIDPVSAPSVQEILIPNARTYTSYRITFEDVRNPAAANSLQIGEIELLGIVGGTNTPELEISRNTNGSLTITSTVDGTLQSTDELGAGAQWNDAGPISGSVTVNASEDAQFFRVVAAE